jgi:hypothetical protein
MTTMDKITIRVWILVAGAIMFLIGARVNAQTIADVERHYVTYKAGTTDVVACIDFASSWRWQGTPDKPGVQMIRVWNDTGFRHYLLVRVYNVWNVPEWIEVDPMRRPRMPNVKRVDDVTDEFAWEIWYKGNR